MTRIIWTPEERARNLAEHIANGKARLAESRGERRATDRLMALDVMLLNQVSADRDRWKRRTEHAEAHLDRVLEENRALSSVVLQQSKVLESVDLRGALPAAVDPIDANRQESPASFPGSVVHHQDTMRGPDTNRPDSPAAEYR